MITFDRVKPLTNYLFKQKVANKTIGLVPTMGALHRGHFSLIAASQKKNDITVCSIYVNPTQFNRASDLKKYPRNLDKDKRQLRSLGCDVLFCPSDKEMYPQPTELKFDFGSLASHMEGKHRPGHFSGVAIVVAKLFHQVKPHRAYFGQKDLQQYIIIQQMVNDFGFDLTLEQIPIIREDDGLALSSRNQRLTKKQRQVAPRLYEGLRLAASQLKQDGDIPKARKTFRKHLKKFKEIELEYFQIVNADNLQPIKACENKKVALCMAAYLGKVRLIDNLVIIC
ncbi:MAG: pantoate--beta-alanine ligase [Cyclobacteriaceae bacterium]